MISKQFINSNNWLTSNLYNNTNYFINIFIIFLNSNVFNMFLSTGTFD